MSNVASARAERTSEPPKSTRRRARSVGKPRKVAHVSTRAADGATGTHASSVSPVEALDTLVTGRIGDVASSDPGLDRRVRDERERTERARKYVDRWGGAERGILGAPRDHYRIDDEHSLGNMLKAAIAPNAIVDDALSAGIDAVADELHVFFSWMVGGDGGQADAAIIHGASAGIEGRLRVLAELSRRMRKALNTADRDAETP